MGTPEQQAGTLIACGCLGKILLKSLFKIKKIRLIVHSLKTK